VAKLYSFWITKNYRESYGVFAVNGILFNHESPRRGENFVTRKITRGLSRIKLGKDEKLFLGNLDAKRDWGHAEDYVEGMWRMLQHHTPDDYVLATGETHTVREFVEKTAAHLGFNLVWKGKGIKEVGIDKNTGKEIIAINPVHFRPAEVDVLLGDYTKAKEAFGWEPTITFEELVRVMTEADFVAEGGTHEDMRTTTKASKMRATTPQKKTSAIKQSPTKRA
jgi:GDPmannose 4,6-dehydratase